MKITIPETFMLNGVTIRVKLDTGLEKKQLYGEACFHSKMIRLSPEIDGEPRPEDAVASTYFHEMVHQILDAMHEHKKTNDEKFVSTFSGLLHQALATSEGELKRKEK